MSYFYCLLRLTVFLFAISSSLTAEIFTVNEDRNIYFSLSEEAKEKTYSVYVNSDQIIVLPEGIFYISESSDLISVKSIEFFSDGLFLVTALRDPACGHTIYCPDCGGCYPRNRCVYRCKCPPKRI